MSALKYWVWMSTLQNIRKRTLLRLLTHFDTPEKVFFARETEYEAIPGLRSEELDSLMQKNLYRAKQVLADCEKLGYQVIAMEDAAYPVRLKTICDPPLVLYVQGRLPQLDEEAAIALVGTRKCTPYGEKLAHRFGYDIAKGGGLLVTGLAAGIDAAGAKGALSAGGKVLGVVGSGLDIVYPRKNEILFQNVRESGAIISEYPPGTRPYRTHFPQRNRIISGISLGVVVVEAPEKSGALITAALALEQGKEVFAVPGNVDCSSCVGTNRMLQGGAVPVLSGWDVLEEYASLFPEKLGRGGRSSKNISEDPPKTDLFVDKTKENQQKSTKEIIDNTKSEEYIDFVVSAVGLSEEERSVLSILAGCDGLCIDEVSVKSGLPVRQVLSVMTLLEISGFAVRVPGNRFALKVSEKCEE